MIRYSKENPYAGVDAVLGDGHGPVCVDLEKMPVEDLTVERPEALSPFVTVEKVCVPQQDISGDRNLELQDATLITPCRVTQEHRPLGNLMRTRKDVYRQSSILR